MLINDLRVVSSHVFEKLPYNKLLRLTPPSVHFVQSRHPPASSRSQSDASITAAGSQNMVGGVVFTRYLLRTLRVVPLLVTVGGVYKNYSCSATSTAAFRYLIILT